MLKMLRLSAEVYGDLLLKKKKSPIISISFQGALLALMFII